jgi:hypothetical protein
MMTWLSDEDRENNAMSDIINQAAKARANGHFVKAAVYVNAQYPYMGKHITLSLPREMTEYEAKEYVKNLGHEKVTGLYDNQGMYHK